MNEKQKAQTEVEVQACPYCGSTATCMRSQFLVGPKKWYVFCENPDCSSTGPQEATRDEAVVAWNRLYRPAE